MDARFRRRAAALALVYTSPVYAILYRLRGRTEHDAEAYTEECETALSRREVPMLLEHDWVA